jgi:hypothetical protein
LAACVQKLRLALSSLRGCSTYPGMEIDAVVALNSLDAAVHRRAQVERGEQLRDLQAQCAIKLTEGTLSRLVHLLQSGCSIQLACDEVPPATHCPPPPGPSPFYSLLSPFRLAYLEPPFTAGRTARAHRTRRIFIMSARLLYLILVRLLLKSPPHRFAAVLSQTRAHRSEQFLESTVTRAYSQ